MFLHLSGSRKCWENLTLLCTGCIRPECLTRGAAVNYMTKLAEMSPLLSQMQVGERLLHQKISQMVDARFDVCW